LNTAGFTTLTVPAGSYPTDENTNTLQVKFSTIPNLTSQGALTINNVQVVANQLYPIAGFLTARFDPVFGNLNDVVFNYTVIDSEGIESNTSTITIPINGEPVANNVPNAIALTNTAPRTTLSPLS